MIKSTCSCLLAFATTVLMPAPSYALVGIGDVTQAFNQLIRAQESSSVLENYIRAFPTWKYRAYEIDGVTYYIDRPDHIKSQLLNGDSWEVAESALMSEHVHAGDVAVDVGAHIGIHTMHLCSLVGESGRVVAIEPQIKLFRELFYNVAANGFGNATLLFNAAGEGRGRVELGPMNMANEGARGLDGGGREFVEMCVLDSLELYQLDFLKIDVNGMEMEVLRGAEKTIERLRPKILIELSDVSAGTDWLEAREYCVTHCANGNYFAEPTQGQVPTSNEHEEIPPYEPYSDEINESVSLDF
jgi:FkbM family methyltransferase